MSNPSSVDLFATSIAFTAGGLAALVVSLWHTRFGQIARPKGAVPWYFWGIQTIYLTAAAFAFSSLTVLSPLFGATALCMAGITIWKFWSQRAQFSLRQAFLVTFATAAVCSLSRYVSAAPVLIFLALPTAEWASTRRYHASPRAGTVEALSAPSVPISSWRQSKWILCFSAGIIVAVLVVQIGIVIPLIRRPLAIPKTWPLLPGQLAPTNGIARDEPPDPPPPGAAAPLAGKSTVVASPTLARVQQFSRKLVFYAKDVDLPYLRLPAADGHAEDFMSRIVPSVLGVGQFDLLVNGNDEGRSPPLLSEQGALSGNREQGRETRRPIGLDDGESRSAPGRHPFPTDAQGVGHEESRLPCISHES